MVLICVSIYAITTDAIDCESDPCHLAWLLRDNRQFLNALLQASCSNGSAFDQLDPTGYDGCPEDQQTTNEIVTSSPSSDAFSLTFSSLVIAVSVLLTWS